MENYDIIKFMENMGEIMKNVLIFRGFGGMVFSTGMDRLGEKLKFLNIPIVVDGYETWSKHYADIAADEDVPVLVGHSFGALACHKIVRSFPKRKFPLVVTFDYSPYYSGIIGHVPDGVVPNNALKAINFYQHVDPLVRGVKMKRPDGSHLGIKNVMTKYAHVEIDKAAELHDEVIRAINKIV